MLIRDIPEFPKTGDRIITVGDANWTPVCCSVHDVEGDGFTERCVPCQTTWKNLYAHLVAVALNNPED